MADHVVGMMVGTSLDGIDAALVAFGDSGKPGLLEFVTADFSRVDPARIRAIASGDPTTAAELSALALALAHDHADAIRRVDPGRRADLVGAHGITVSHVPGADPGHGWQLLSGAALAALSGRDVACDFRGADLALGGQGAPLAPVADLALRVAPDEDRVILNLGGISNFTALPAGARRSGEAIAGDAGPANLVLDGYARRIGIGDFDEDGQLGGRGMPVESLVASMFDDPWFALPLPRSAGREQFGDHWLDRFLAAAPSGSGEPELMASLVRVCARAVADQLDRLPGDWRRAERARLLVTGGGRRNRAMMAALAELLPAFEVEAIEAIGENGDAKEAIDFAWLARERRHGRPLDLAPLTGASRNTVAGALYLATECDA